MLPSFKIAGLDHVAINVKDMEASANWYTEVLGLRKVRLAQWGNYPVFMMSGSCGVALFPADAAGGGEVIQSKKVRIDHFAFRVDNDAFHMARARFEALGIVFTFQDHYYFHSMYINDPDEHTVELTTLVVPEDQVFGEL